jgi:hypothetical protein
MLMNYTDTSSDDFEASCTRVNHDYRFTSTIMISSDSSDAEVPNIVVGLRDVIASRTPVLDSRYRDDDETSTGGTIAMDLPSVQIRQMTLPSCELEVIYGPEFTIGDDIMNEDLEQMC